MLYSRGAVSLSAHFSQIAPSQRINIINSLNHHDHTPHIYFSYEMQYIMEEGQTLSKNINHNFHHHHDEVDDHIHEFGVG